MAGKAKPDKLDKRLAAVKTASVDELASALRSATGVLVAAAARRVADERIDALVPELAPAFAQLGDAKRDPGCRGKIAIARALHELDHWDDRVFVAGLTIVQREGWGDPPDDTAAELRGICGIAHAHFARVDALDVLAELLADPERVTRIGAAQGLGGAGRRDATALLRFKLRVGDDDSEVLSACLEALLSIARDDAVPFVVSLLAEHDERAECAALALGGTRIAAALEPLVAWCDACTGPQRYRVAYLALALLRHDTATAKLLDVVRDGAKPAALAAGGALATFRDVPAIAEQLRAAAADRTDLAELFR